MSAERTGESSPRPTTLDDLRQAVADAVLHDPQMGVAAADLTGVILEHDETFAELLGRPGQDLRGIAYQSFADPEHRAELLASIAVVTGGSIEQRTGERLFRHPDGRGVWLHTTGRIVRDDAGRPDHLVGVIHDVTRARTALDAAEAEVNRRRLADERRADDERRQQELLDSSPSAVIVHSGGVVRYANAAAVAMYRATTTSEIVGRPITDFVHPEDRPIVAARLEAMADGQTTGASREVRHLRCDGTTFPVWPSLAPRLWDGAPAVQVLIRDVTAEISAAEQLAERERFHTEILDSMGPQALVLDKSGCVASFNRAWSEHLERLGVPGSTPVGADFIQLCRMEVGARAPMARELADGLEHMLTGAGREFFLDIEVLYPLSPGCWYAVHALPMLSTGGVVINLTDVTERKSFEAELTRQAMHDPLTGLPNRLLLQDRLQLALATQPRRRGPVALLFVDIDNFKLINDSYGHEAGDEILAAFADRLAPQVRPGDTVGRFAGDEFVIVIESLVNAEDILGLADRVLHAIRGAYSVPGGNRVQLSASAGIAVAEPGQDASALIRSADAAMFEAKNRGRDQAVLFDSALSGRARDRLEMTQQLRQAAAAGELRLYFQPLLDVASGVIVGAEALVRWKRPGYGVLPPSAFISLAESTGLIMPVGLWVLETAVQWVAQQASPGNGDPFGVSVNIAARQLMSRGFADTVARVLESARLPAGQLTLEITESTVMDEPVAAGTVLRALRDLGVRLSIDDFGTGYSSLTYLQRFPVDELKIDRSFVDGLGTDAADEAIVAAIVSLAHTLGLAVVAEGVETPVQLERVRALGCERAQGFLIARPLPPADLDIFLAASVSH